MGAEKLPGHSFLNQEIDRRTLFRGGAKVAAGLATAAALYEIDKHGIAFELRPPDEPPYPFSLDPGEEIIFPPEFAQGREMRITKPKPVKKKVFTPNTPNYLEENPQVLWGHRWGNNIEKMNEGYEMGVRMFDIDANIADIGGEKIFAEHGDIVTFWGKFIAVVDWNERELRIRGKRPNTVEEVVNNAKTLPGSSVTIECKRGTFTKRWFNKLLDIIGDMPGIIQVSTFQEFEVVQNLITERNSEFVTVAMSPNAQEGFQMVA